MLYIIDGTGAMCDDDYATDMNRGFCSKLRQQNGRNAKYWRGPTVLGTETWEIADKVFEQIRKDQPRKIILVGHSRGGAACVHVAWRLKEQGISVQGMLLLDAVRRAISSPATYLGNFATGYVLLSGGIAGSNPTLFLTGLDLKMSAPGVARDFGQEGNQRIDTIPSTVGKALHLKRDEQFSYYFLEALTAAQSQLNDAPGSKGHSAERFKPSNALEKAKLQGKFSDLKEFHQNMRDACRFEVIIAGQKTSFSFGNTALGAEPGCKLTKAYYLATHGAMGGAPLNPYDYISDFSYAA